MITSQNRPGLPDFSRVTLKNMGRPGDEAMYHVDCICSSQSRLCIQCILKECNVLVCTYSNVQCH